MRGYESMNRMRGRNNFHIRGNTAISSDFNLVQQRIITDICTITDPAVCQTYFTINFITPSSNQVRREILASSGIITFFLILSQGE